MQGFAQGGAGAGAASNVRFGPFELDLRAGELRKEGRAIRLQDQPFRILRLLVEHPSEVIPRGDIRNALWPDGTVVEYEHSINAAMKRLRDALRDSADKPRYIETVARRGYRFICPVEARRTPSTADGAAAEPAIAVLPFADMGGDPENEYFCDGLAEEILNELAHVPGLKVIARTSSFTFKGKQDDIRKIAAALSVTHVLEGSARRSGGRVRVMAQLIAAADGGHLWSERYDRDLADIFAIQDEIARAIATALCVRLSRPVRLHTASLPAYDAYLKARHCAAVFTRESLARSREYYDRAIALDPGFAGAQSGLAMSFILSVLPGLLASHIAMPQARAAAERALDLDPESAEAHAALGIVAAYYDYDPDEAERRFRLAMAREPVSPEIRWHYAMAWLLVRSRLAECVEQSVRALKDDPLSFVGGFQCAGALLAAGKVEEGEAQLRELCALHPNLYQSFYLLGLSQALRGLHAEALASAGTAYSLASWNTTCTGLFAGELIRAGQKSRAGELLQKLLPGDRYGTPVGLLIFHLACGEPDQAAEWARRVSEERDPRLIFVMALMRVCAQWSALASALHLPPMAP